jgi:DNA-binding GntR family transcriptional regulator
MVASVPSQRTGSTASALPPLELDRREIAAPLHVQVSRHIESAIDDGVLRPGDRLDGEIALAEQLGVSRATMRQAFRELELRGLLLRKHGVGTHVMDAGRRRQTGLSSLHYELAEAGRRPSTRVLLVERGEAHADVAEALDLRVGAEVLVLRRVRLADGEPVAVMCNWLPADLIDVVPHDLERRGLYELLRVRGLKMRVARQVIAAAAADAVQGQFLDVAEGTPLLTLRTVTYTDRGRPVDYGLHAYRPDRYRFEVINVNT